MGAHREPADAGCRELVTASVFSGRPEEVAVARSWATKMADTWDCEAMAAAMVVTELITNAVRHTRSGQPGGTVIVVLVSGGPGGMAIHVHDLGADNGQVPTPCPVVSGGLTETGRGLHIVAMVAEEWGYGPAAACSVWGPGDPAAQVGGCCTWCRLPKASERQGGEPAAGGAPEMAILAVPAAGMALGLAAGHVPMWAGLVAAALMATVGMVRAGLARLVYGPRRPWMPFRLRVRLRMHPGPGWAGWWALSRAHGLPAARKVARYARPSLSWAALRFGPWQEYATFLGWAQGWLWRHSVYAHLESLILMIAAPQDGKTQAAAGHVIDAPGPVVATSIRGDLLRATSGLRALWGRLQLWDPEQVSGLASTFQWNMVSGCAEVAVAVRRAGHMTDAVQAKSLDGEAFWNDQASMVLAALLHAAALASADMRHVLAWAGGGDDVPLRILDAHPSASPVARNHLELYLSLPDRTRQSVAATLVRVLKFMQLPACTEAVITADGGPGFDFEAFVRSRDTLYLVAGDSASSLVAPLFAALVAELAHAARRATARLDPPLTVILDEAGNIAPVPVASWASWAAGSGIRLHVIAQAYAQLTQRWGTEGAALIWQCCKTKVIFGGTSEDDLAAITERACGTVRLRTAERDGRGASRGHEAVPLLPAATLRMLPTGRAVVINGRAAPTIIRVAQVRHRSDYKSQQAFGSKTVFCSPVPSPVPAPILPPPDSPGPACATAAPIQLHTNKEGRQ